MALGRRAGFGGRASADGEGGGEEGVNLVPIMNLFVVLIPFLLLSAAFFNISVINASVPALQTDKTDLAKQEEAVTLMVQILPSGMRVAASSDTLPASTLGELRAEVGRKADGGLDFAAFGEHLFRCKQRFPKSDTMILVPEASVSYEEVIGTMDAARWWQAEPEETAGASTRYEMFPNVVISGML